jgi:hypothetical protein
MAAFSFALGSTIWTTLLCASRFPYHVGRAVDIHGGTHLSVPHELLLHPDADRILRYSYKLNGLMPAWLQR